MKLTPFLFITFLAHGAMAAAEEHAAAHGSQIPGRLIFWQIFNLTILFGGLTYFLRKPLVDFFRQRQSGYVAAASQSQAARQEAEKHYFEIKNKIEYLEQSHDESVARAEAEAADLRKAMLKEAEELSARILNEAETTVRLELQKARQELHEKFVNEAVTAARTVLSKDIAAQDHSRLQSEFVKHIEAVQS